MKSKITAIMLASAMVLPMAGCGKKTSDATLTYWTPIYSSVSQTASNYGETELYKALQEQSGVKLEFTHPAIGQEKESFNIMIASGDLPDLIEYDFIANYKGGVQKALKDGVIIPIDEYLDMAPNYKKALAEHPEWEKQTVTDDGTHYCFASFLDGDETRCWQGLQIRDDLLKKANLPLPETIEDWDKTLREFKKMGIEYPLSCVGVNHNSMFCTAFGIGERFYQDNGVAKYGVVEPAYKNYLELWKKWYEEGLVDPDYFAQDGKTYDAKISSGQVGAFFGTAGGGMGKYLPALRETNPEYSLAGAKFPVANKGEKAKYVPCEAAYRPNLSVYISSSCKNIEAAVKLLDYGYSEKGHMLYNFGIENTSYKMENGYPKYTDEVLNNPDGLGVQFALAKYSAAVYGGPFVSDTRYYEQYLTMPEQKAAVKNWAEQDDSGNMPKLTFTQEESDKVASLQTAVDSYVSENLINFITGKKPMSDWDSFTQQVKSMGITEILKVYQAALDRYNSR